MAKRKSLGGSIEFHRSQANEFTKYAIDELDHAERSLELGLRRGDCSGAIEGFGNAARTVGMAVATITAASDRGDGQVRYDTRTQEILKSFDSRLDALRSGIKRGCLKK